VSAISGKGQVGHIGEREEAAFFELLAEEVAGLVGRVAEIGKGGVEEGGVFGLFEGEFEADDHKFSLSEMIGLRSNPIISIVNKRKKKRRYLRRYL
jgi:hypothetical protein